jgi:hypothetical protein
VATREHDWLQAGVQLWLLSDLFLKGTPLGPPTGRSLLEPQGMGAIGRPGSASVL